MTMYATLEEAIDAAREEFLADNPDLDADDASVQQLNVQKYVLQDGDIMWQAEFFADEDEEGECLPMLSGKRHKASLMAIMMRLKFARSGWRKIPSTSGMKANSSLNRLWIPRKVRRQPTNGMSGNYS